MAQEGEGLAVPLLPIREKDLKANYRADCSDNLEYLVTGGKPVRRKRGQAGFSISSLSLLI